ncbi:MAG: ABC transporter permease [Gemmatimonadetes bacterium]|nr:ABC transporter permease [Gemmatimonadota bacterium]
MSNGPSSSTLARSASRPFQAVGKLSLSVAEHAGQLALLLGRSARAVATLQVSFRSVLQQIYIMGAQSIPIVLVTAVLAGIVTSQQGGYQFTGAIPLYILGSVVVESVILELGPVLTAIVLVGRVGARVTAELGTMRVSEQIEAFEAMGRDPIAILAAPRILAGIIVVPILVALADVVGIIAGMIAARLTVGLGFDAFLYGARLFWHTFDLGYSLVKALTFGFAIPVIAVHMGLRTGGGAAGVGRTTTGSVMFMTLTVLILDAIFPPLLLQ